MNNQELICQLVEQINEAKLRNNKIEIAFYLNWLQDAMRKELMTMVDVLPLEYIKEHKLFLNFCMERFKMARWSIQRYIRINQFIRNKKRVLKYTKDFVKPFLIYSVFATVRKDRITDFRFCHLNEFAKIKYDTNILINIIKELLKLNILTYDMPYMGINEIILNNVNGIYNIQKS